MEKLVTLTGDSPYVMVLTSQNNWMPHMPSGEGITYALFAAGASAVSGWLFWEMSEYGKHVMETNEVVGQNIMINAQFPVFALAVILCWAFFRFTRRMRRGEDLEGCVFALFLALYGAAQVVLDSTRYDADFFRFNGFVHLTQVLAAAAVALSAAWLSVRAVKKTGLRPWHWGCWAALAGGMGLAGYMEYYVQRRADQAALGYGLMSGGMALAGAACVLLCVGRNRAARKGKRSIGPEKI